MALQSRHVGLTPRFVRYLAVLLFGALVLAVFGLDSPRQAFAQEEPQGNVIEACYSAPYSPDQKLPFDVSQEEWCHPLFATIDASTEMGGVVKFSWEPASDHVYWYCGPGYGKQVCPINEYRLEASNYGETVRCSVDQSGRSCTLRGLTTDYTQPVTLSAYLANGNWFRVHLLVEPCCKPPSSPIGVNAVASQDAIDVTWSAPHHWGGASELTYKVFTEPPSKTCMTEGLACRLEGLSYGQEYVVMVEATNPAGSAPVASTSSPTTLEVSTPSAPLNVRTDKLSDGKIVVRWDEPESTGGREISKYEVRVLPGRTLCSAKSQRRQCAFSNLRGGRTYSFTVAAVNSLGSGMPSAPVSLTVKRVRQQPPLNVTAEGELGAIRVSWDEPSDVTRKSKVRYVVETANGRSRCITRDQSCTLSGLASGQTYVVNVVARSLRGTSKKTSAAATIPVPRAEPPKPVLQVS